MNGNPMDVSAYGYTGAQIAQQNTLAQLRLDTEHLLERIELYLRGKDLQLHDKGDGEIHQIVVTIGKPKMNDEGIQSVMWRLNSIVTSHIVQGNLTKEDHVNKVYYIYTDLATNLIVNLHNWGCDIKDYDVIIDTMVSQIDLFLSRLIDNKERESYVPTMQSVERNITNDGQQKSGIGAAVGRVFGG